MIRMNERSFYTNVGLLHCRSCGGESIISIERMEKSKQGHLSCPYCGQTKTKITAKTNDDNRGEYHFGAFTLIEPID